MHERTTPVAEQVPGPATPDLSIALTILAEGAAAIGQTSQQLGALPPAERLAALVAPILGLLRDRLGFDIVWVAIGDGQRPTQLVRCELGAAFAGRDAAEFAPAVEPILATLRLSAERGQLAPSRWLV